MAASIQLTDYHVDLVQLVVSSYLKKTTPPSEYYLYRDEFESIGYLAIVKAAKNFDPDRGVLFKTYASNYIRKEILDYLRKLKKIREWEVSENDLWSDEENKEHALCYSVPDFTEKYDREEELDELDTDLIEPPTDPLECEVYYSHILGGEGFKKMAKRLHKDHWKLRKIKAELLERFKNQIETKKNKENI